MSPGLGADHHPLYVGLRAALQGRHKQRRPRTIQALPVTIEYQGLLGGY